MIVYSVFATRTWLIIAMSLFFNVSVFTQHVNLLVKGDRSFTGLNLVIKSLDNGIFASTKVDTLWDVNADQMHLTFPAEHIPAQILLTIDGKYQIQKVIILGSEINTISLTSEQSGTSSMIQLSFSKDNLTEQYEKINELSGEPLRQISILEQLLSQQDAVNPKITKLARKDLGRKWKSYNAKIQAIADTSNSDIINSLAQLYTLPHAVLEFPGKHDVMYYRERFQSLDLNNKSLIHTYEFKNLLDEYVNAVTLEVKSASELNSKLVQAGKEIIESAKYGNPRVYGWVVDYFFIGYEQFNLQEGIKMLEPYLRDENCLTSKRQSIHKRLQGIDKLVSGFKLPDFTLPDIEGKSFSLYNAVFDEPKYALVVWSPDCPHCIETLEKLNGFMTSADKPDLRIIAVGLGPQSGKEAWGAMAKNWKGIYHLYAVEGINSRFAEDYYILGTPVLILADASNHFLIEVSEDTLSLINAVQKK